MGSSGRTGEGIVVRAGFRSASAYCRLCCCGGDRGSTGVGVGVSVCIKSGFRTTFSG